MTRATIVLTLLGGMLLLVYKLWLTPNQSSPLYFGTLQLGPPQSDESQQWQFMVQGDAIYLDHNRDRKPQPDERIDPDAPDISATVDSDTFLVTAIHLGVNPTNVSPSLTQKLLFAVQVVANHPYQMSGTLELHPQSELASNLQFGGPLEFICQQAPILTINSPDPMELKFLLANDYEATQDLAKNGTPVAEFPIVRVEKSLRNISTIVPEKTPPFPKLTIVFPLAGSDAIVQTYDLDHFC